MTPSITRPAALVRLIASLVMMRCICSGHAQALPPTASSSSFLFSVDVLLDEANAPVPLGIRDGQTVMQAAVVFCREQGFDEAMQSVLMPQLVKVLEDGVADAIGDSLVGEESLPPSPALEHADLAGGAGSTVDSSAGDVVPVFNLDISLDGEEMRTLSYYADQDPMEVAVAFCTESLPPSSHSEAFSRCSSALAAHITERVDPARNSSSSGHRQQEEQPQQSVIGKDAANTIEPWLTVPLNIDGIETALEIHRGSVAEDLADEICRRKAFGLEASSLDSCLSQVATIALRAMTAYSESQEQEERRRQKAETDAFTFKVPVTLAGLQLHAEFRTSETPRASALRFCEPILPEIESALGLDLVGEEDGDNGAIGQDGGGVLSGGRNALKEACAVVVEDAINAVLLGLRERVLEAEMAQKTATESQNNSNNEQWLQEESIAGRVDDSEEPRASRQTAADMLLSS